MENDRSPHYEHSEHYESSSKKTNLTEKIRTNPWIISTFVVGILAIILIVSSFSGGITGKTISEDKAAELVLAFIESQGDSVELVDVRLESGLYKVTVLYGGSETPLYITKDGKNLASLFPLSLLLPEEPETIKSDRPEVGLYIWSYCPYGVTALGPFADVALLLGDYADFKVYLYYAGHGDFEIQQNKIQACIQSLGYDKYWEYAKTFADEIYDKCYGDVACDLAESVALMNSLGIDSDTVMACVDSQGDSLTENDYNSAKEVEVTGSPSLVINDIKVSPSSRTAEAFKDEVCQAFNEPPEECGTALDSTGTIASGNC